MRIVYSVHIPATLLCTRTIAHGLSFAQALAPADKGPRARGLVRGCVHGLGCCDPSERVRILVLCQVACWCPDTDSRLELSICVVSSYVMDCVVSRLRLCHFPSSKALVGLDGSHSMRPTACVLTRPVREAVTCPCYTSHREDSRDKSIQPPLEQFVGHANATRMLYRRQRILHHILDVQIGPDLMQVLAEIDHLCVGEHDKLHARGRLVVVQLVLAGAVGEEGVVGAAELGDEVAQGEDETEDELLVVAV